MAAHTKAKPVECTFAYPDHLLDPEEWLNFIEMHGFTDDWARLGLDDEDLFAMQVAIQAHPKGSPVIKGTGGLRKLRFAAHKKGRKKSVRIGYVYFQEAAVVLLVVAYAKNEMDNIPAADRTAYKALIKRQHDILSHRAVK